MVLKFDTIYTYIYVLYWYGPCILIAFMNTRLDRQLSYPDICLEPSDLLPTTRSTQIKSATADSASSDLMALETYSLLFFFSYYYSAFSVSRNYFTFSLQLYTFKNIYKRVGWQREMGGMKKTLIKNNQRGSRGNIYTGIWSQAKLVVQKAFM